MNITFYGAAREVTGSSSLLETGGRKFLVDCGMFQGGEFNERKNSEPFSFNPAEVEAVIITHAHLDHTGRLPLLVKSGFKGDILATPATADLTRLILQDAWEVMEYNHRKFSSPILYSLSDVEMVMRRFKPVEYYQCLPLPKRGIEITFHDAGHIFGSAFVEILADGKRAVFSGDVGNVDVPILRDTDALPAGIDALICESTYGDRIHETAARREEILRSLIMDAIKRGGALMIPAFSLERTQELLYYLNNLIDRRGLLPRVPIFLDSPLAIAATAVYRHYPDHYDEEARRLQVADDDLFQFPGLKMTDTREQSKEINNYPNPKIIIAGAGMMNGGRIIHHARRYLSDPASTLLIVGYQAQGTLGRRILDGETPVNVMGERVAVKCQVKAIGALSAHADQEKLLDWIGGGQSLPKKVYLNHGEPPASAVLRQRLADELGTKVTVVDAGLTVKV